MSKAALKKELENLSREQLIEVIGAAYSSSKEARAYFEFFLNPDADALLDNKIDIISKELARAKRGYSKARITVIRKAIRDFSSFGVGDEYVGRLMYAAIRMIAGRILLLPRHTHERRPQARRGIHRPIRPQCHSRRSNGEHRAARKREYRTPGNALPHNGNSPPRHKRPDIA